MYTHALGRSEFYLHSRTALVQWLTLCVLYLILSDSAWLFLCVGGVLL